MTLKIIFRFHEDRKYPEEMALIEYIIIMIFLCVRFSDGSGQQIWDQSIVDINAFILPWLSKCVNSGRCDVGLFFVVDFWCYLYTVLYRKQSLSKRIWNVMDVIKYKNDWNRLLEKSTKWKKWEKIPHNARKTIS